MVLILSKLLFSIPHTFQILEVFGKQLIKVVKNFVSKKSIFDKFFQLFVL